VSLVKKSNGLRFLSTSLLLLFGLTTCSALISEGWAESNALPSSGTLIAEVPASYTSTYRPLKIPVNPSIQTHTPYQGSYYAPSHSVAATQSRLPAYNDYQKIKRREASLTQYIMGYNRSLSREQANLMAEAILAFSKYYQVDFRLITGVISVESSFRTDAISSSGAIGLGQLKPATAQWLGVGNPYDPIENISGMSRYLSYLINKYNGNLDQAVSAYYQGPGATDRNGITDNAKGYLYRVNDALARCKQWSVF
jgi:soluble lytic murein transglycosylase-like protein